MFKFIKRDKFNNKYAAAAAMIFIGIVVVGALYQFLVPEKLEPIFARHVENCVDMKVIKTVEGKAITYQTADNAEMQQVLDWASQYRCTGSTMGDDLFSRKSNKDSIVVFCTSKDDTYSAVTLLYDGRVSDVIERYKIRGFKKDILDELEKIADGWEGEPVSGDATMSVDKILEEL